MNSRSSQLNKGKQRPLTEILQSKKKYWKNLLKTENNIHLHLDQTRSLWTCVSNQQCQVFSLPNYIDNINEYLNDILRIRKMACMNIYFIRLLPNWIDFFFYKLLFDNLSVGRCKCNEMKSNWWRAFFVKEYIILDWKVVFSQFSRTFKQNIELPIFENIRRKNIHSNFEMMNIHIDMLTLVCVDSQLWFLDVCSWHFEYNFNFVQLNWCFLLLIYVHTSCIIFSRM